MEYFWRATYKDGEFVTSLDTPYEHIDRRLLRRFEIVNRETGLAAIAMPFEPADCLIWRKRVQMKSDGTRSTFHLVCRERAVGAFYIQLLDEADGAVRTGLRFDPKVPALSEPERLPFEI